MRKCVTFRRVMLVSFVAIPGHCRVLRATTCMHVDMAGCMGFLWLTGFSFFHCVASPFHSFVTTMHVDTPTQMALERPPIHGPHPIPGPLPLADRPPPSLLVPFSQRRTAQMCSRDRFVTQLEEAWLQTVKGTYVPTTRYK